MIHADVWTKGEGQSSKLDVVGRVGSLDLIRRSITVNDYFLEPIASAVEVGSTLEL
jgi:hypothetical protein